MNNTSEVLSYNTINWHYLLKILYFKDYFNQEELIELSKTCKRFRNFLRSIILRKVYFNNDPEFTFNKRIKSNYSNGYPSIPEGELKTLFENYKKFVFEEKRTINCQLNSFQDGSTSLDKRITHFTIRHFDNFYLVNLPSFDNLVELCLYNTYILKKDFLKIFSSINLLLKLSLIQVQVVYFDGDIVNLEEIKLPNNLRSLEINESYFYNQITDENSDKTQFPDEEGIQDYGYITDDLETANVFPYYLNFLNTDLVSKFIAQNSSLKSIGIDLVIKYNQNLELFRNLASLSAIYFDCGECDLNLEDFKFPPLVSVTTLSFSNIIDHHHRYIEKLILNCPNLTNLQIDMDGKFMRVCTHLFPKIPNLKSLTITNIMSKPIFNIFLRQHPNLECLNLEFFPIDCVDLSRFDKLPNLKIINLIKSNNDPDLNKAKIILKAYPNWYCINGYRSIHCYSINHYSRAKLNKMRENFKVKINTKRALKDHKVPFRIIEKYETNLTAQPDLTYTLETNTPKQPELINIAQTNTVTQQELTSTSQNNISMETTPKVNVYTNFELSKYLSKTKNRTTCRVKIDSELELKNYLSRQNNQKRLKLSSATEYIANNNDFQHHRSSTAYVDTEFTDCGTKSRHVAQIDQYQTPLTNPETGFQYSINPQKTSSTEIKNTKTTFESNYTAHLVAQQLELPDILDQDLPEMANDKILRQDTRDLHHTQIELQKTAHILDLENPFTMKESQQNSEAVNTGIESQNSLVESFDKIEFKISGINSDIWNCSTKIINPSLVSEVYVPNQKPPLSLHASNTSIESKARLAENLDSMCFNVSDTDSAPDIINHLTEITNIKSAHTRLAANYKTNGKFSVNQIELEISSQLASDERDICEQFFKDKEIDNSIDDSHCKAGLNSSNVESDSNIQFFSNKSQHLKDTIYNRQQYQVHPAPQTNQVKIEIEAINIESEKNLTENANLNQDSIPNNFSEIQNRSNIRINSKTAELNTDNFTNSKIDSDYIKSSTQTSKNQENSASSSDNISLEIPKSVPHSTTDLISEDYRDLIKRTPCKIPILKGTIDGFMLQQDFVKRPIKNPKPNYYIASQRNQSYFSSCIPSIFNLKGHLIKNSKRNIPRQQKNTRRALNYTVEKNYSQKEVIVIDSDSE